MIKKVKNEKTVEELLEEALEEEQPYEVPENWVWTNIKTLANVKGGKRLPKGEKLIDKQTGHPYLRVADFNNGSIDKSDLKYITREIHEKISRYTISSDDVYISIAGTIGKVGLVPLQLDGANLTENAAKITNLKCTDNIFLYQVLNTEGVKSQINSSIKATTQPKLALHRIQDLKIPLPPINEQKRINDKVERLLNKIDKAKQFIDEAKETFELRRATILDKAFRGELTAKWREENGELQSSIGYIEKVRRDYYKSIGKKMSTIQKIKPKDAPFDIPKEWTWVKAIDVCDVRDGTHDSPKYKEKGYPLITSKNLKNGVLDFTNVNYIDEIDHISICKRSKVDEGDILFAMIGTIGNPVLIREIKGEFSIKNVALFKPLRSIYGEYLAYYLESLNYLEPLKKNAKGSTQKFVGLGKLRESLLPVPPLEEQIVIIKLINELFNYEKQIRENIINVNLEQIKQSIISKAFRGELGTNDPSEESAIKLLKEVLQEQVK
jgi:type I restriction enzyme S subunit